MRHSHGCHDDSTSAAHVRDPEELLSASLTEVRTPSTPKAHPGGGGCLLSIKLINNSKHEIFKLLNEGKSMQHPERTE